MQPINANRSKDQNSYPVQKKSTGHNQPSAKASDDYNGTATNTPEDFVELSTPHNFTQSSTKGKKTSTHVTNEEKKALFDSFSSKSSFSVYT